MRISVWNLKGGVGKTHLSLALSKDLDLKYYSNENNFIDGALLIKDNPDISENAIFDFGGFVDKISDYLKISDLVLIPTTNDYFSILKTFETFKLSAQFNQNILFVLTRIQSKIKDKDIDILKKHGRMLELNESNIFKKSIETNQGILTLSEIFCYKNKKIVDQYKNLIDEIARL